MATEYFNALTDASGGRDMSLPVSLSTIAELLDYSMLPKERKDRYLTNLLERIRLAKELENKARNLINQKNLDPAEKT